MSNQAELFAPIALLCKFDCGIEDATGMTKAEATAEGWRDVEPISAERAADTDGELYPWWSHEGVCPLCAAEGDTPWKAKCR